MKEEEESHVPCLRRNAAVAHTTLCTQGHVRAARSSPPGSVSQGGMHGSSWLRRQVLCFRSGGFGERGGGSVTRMGEEQVGMGGGGAGLQESNLINLNKR